LAYNDSIQNKISSMKGAQTSSPSEYEKQAIQEIYAWRNPPSTWYSRTTSKISSSWNEVTDLVRKIPGVEWTMENVVSGLLEVTNEITQDSVWTDEVYKEFREAGPDVNQHSDIYALDLEHVDSTLSGLNKKYTALAAAEGTATGLAGAAGIIPDLIALVSINLRAAGEYASYCGFDISSPRERLFAMELLDYVASSSDTTKDVTLAPAVRTASKVAKTQSTNVLEQLGIMEAIERAARALGLKLTGAKLAQVVPVAGAVIGGGFNALYTAKVCKSAFNLYRERFLVEKYGKGILS